MASNIRQYSSSHFRHSCSYFEYLRPHFEHNTYFSIQGRILNIYVRIFNIKNCIFDTSTYAISLPPMLIKVRSRTRTSASGLLFSHDGECGVGIIGREGLGEVLYVVEDLIARLDGLSINHGDAVGLILRIDILKRMLVGLNVDDSVMETVDRAYNSLTNICNGRANGGEVHAVRQFTGRRGRPSFDIN